MLHHAVTRAHWALSAEAALGGCGAVALWVRDAVQDGAAEVDGNKVFGYQEQAVQQLCAPVTVKAVKAAVGELHLPELLQQYA